MRNTWKAVSDSWTITITILYKEYNIWKIMEDS